MFAFNTLAILGLTTIVQAIRPPQYNTAITAADLIRIAADTESCTEATYADECRTASAAAPAIAISFTNFAISSFGAQAALVAIMLFESGDFKYNKNHFPAPGRPGQGTRNMQSADFNEKYAEYLSIVCTNCGITPADVEKAKGEGPAAVLELVSSDQWSFGSAAWFLRTQCDATIEDGLAAGTEAGFKSYIEDCVGTTLTDDRIAGWQKVMALKQCQFNSSPTAIMGISRDSRHKRSASGAKRAYYRKKRAFEKGRQPANTRIGAKRVHLVRTRGGNRKFRALRLDSGNFSWGSEGIARKVRVIAVAFHPSNNELVRTNTLTKSAVVQVDAAPFRQWYEAHYGAALGRRRQQKAEEEVKKSKSVESKQKERHTAQGKVESALERQFEAGRLYAVVASRPGQSGRVDGYILEGEELAFYQRAIRK
ncbi:unnamed protein product [Zymoseptoria tritici ST99CH_3D7]|uniref:40S ribosomal protein S8 n=1 Tax=Zymoseptoria tritici (strain ST99CH_3D7) TaxID=1276538 RepID=A0A1X7RHA7_ZYMT9|nr:unnamed protein product [Zymoseptoria tritici ST99CH_3D7]